MTEEMKIYKQYAFEEFFKTVLRNKARNLHKKLNTIERHEVAAANFEADVFDTVAAEDAYQLESQCQFIFNANSSESCLTVKREQAGHRHSEKAHLLPSAGPLKK